MDENGHFSRLISCADFDVSSCQEEISGTSSKVSKSPQNPSSPLLKFSRTHQNLFLSGDLRGTFSNF